MNSLNPDQPQTENREKKQNALTFATLAGMVGELGLIIATPLVVIILAGIWLDKKLNTTPLFIIVGILLSITTSAITIGRKIKRLNKINGI
jgi:F0F1-type ATP synthase assembly protein I